MPDPGGIAPAAAPPATDWRRLAAAHWPMWLGLAAMALPTMIPSMAGRLQVFSTPSITAPRALWAR
ncbi:MAG: hypothetical protein B7Z50_01600 [Sphingomonadales bacterium 12-62-5]|nr:MAG: hypothetical protein B7Z50_01600 [Sphingomonadales bacterium 12-62-5]